MPRPDKPQPYEHRFDAERLRVAGELRTALDAYHPPVVEGLRRRYGGLDGAQSRTESTLTLFGVLGTKLGELVDELDTRRNVYRSKRRGRQGAVAERQPCQKDLYDEIGAVRQVVDGRTRRQANRFLDVEGPTPRHPDELLDWGTRIPGNLAKVPLKPSLCLEHARALERRTRKLAKAREKERQTKVSEREALSELTAVRRELDQELKRIEAHIRSSLALAGEERLSRFVVRKRTGRPSRWEMRKRERAAERAERSKVAEKLDAKAPAAAIGDEKLVAAPKSDAPGAFSEVLESEPGSRQSRTDKPGAEDASCEHCTEQTVSSEGSCNPCTEMSGGGEVVSFQEDTPRAVRRRRRRFSMSARVVADAAARSFRWIGRSLQARRPDES